MGERTEYRCRLWLCREDIEFIGISSQAWWLGNQRCICVLAKHHISRQAIRNGKENNRASLGSGKHKTIRAINQFNRCLYLPGKVVHCVGSLPGCHHIDAMDVPLLSQLIGFLESVLLIL